jgi:hypothetical protein
LIHHSDQLNPPSTHRWPIPTDWSSSGSPWVGLARRWLRLAFAEAVNAAYKTELITPRKPWRCVDEDELATAEWVAWYNQERLHVALGYVPPAEYEAALTGTSHHASPPTPSRIATTKRVPLRPASPVRPISGEDPARITCAGSLQRRRG